MRVRESGIGLALTMTLLAPGCGDDDVSPVEPRLGLGLVLEFQPYDALIDPVRSRLYMSQRLGASIVQVDYASMRVLSTRELSTSPGWMDLADNGFGLELYVPVGGGINVYNAETLSDVSSISTGFAPSVLTDAGDLVFASTGPPNALDARSASLRIDRPLR